MSTCWRRRSTFWTHPCAEGEWTILLRHASQGQRGAARYQCECAATNRQRGNIGRSSLAPRLDALTLLTNSAQPFPVSEVATPAPAPATRWPALRVSTRLEGLLWPDLRRWPGRVMGTWQARAAPGRARRPTLNRTRSPPPLACWSTKARNSSSTARPAVPTAFPPPQAVPPRCTWCALPTRERDGGRSLAGPAHRPASASGSDDASRIDQSARGGPQGHSLRFIVSYQELVRTAGILVQNLTAWSDTRKPLPPKLQP